MGILFNQKKIKTLPKFGVHYNFEPVDVGEDKIQAIRILDGPYRDVIYFYGRVGVGIDGILKFDYHIKHIPDTTFTHSLQSIEFVEVIGDILVSIITNDQKQGEYASLREHDIKEPNI